ncbi:carboxymuconolactone decarboxylase family protein [Roseivirga pacifica]|uniref:carboxymuconolactone decarboxylase family protein n=1 Tax=Roseivirga pacifica TaxID=1267423 RepID=UPI002094FB05|nr:carboxymuconolactone decarboxylase family protein [Roseivirga pacifica]MCO6357812.1 carboxymuconolactone decarboxylase family protein [Roseivirga pacifica]MCO6366064.1 carboxymuconolactone decarboxylase family protein [Roseivirga pacifica]MCO6371392.1 carboxymuconolactone decarboxylase family protein [Roseivirga pacifica]MCO6375436.1 carboxymuconolactone decarboxylase family protein [Roseivirga pacifica]MCO6378770.1 carboxymuconolactone decarboxylase family protein [Roseivirga pacifica]
METFNVPTREEVSEQNQAIFDNLKNALGFVPNLYATMAHSENALGNYLQLQQGKTSFSNKEKEVINLVVSQGNECSYCQSAHTAISKMNGFTDEQILELRSGKASFNEKFDALVKLASEVNLNRGKVDAELVENFYSAGYTKGHLVDLVVAVADKVVMNYLHNLTQIPVDFPAAPALESVEA